MAGKKSTKANSRSKTQPSGRLSKKQVALYRHFLSGGSLEDESTE